MTTERVDVETAAAGKYLSMSQAARELGLSKDTVRAMVDSGKLRGFQSTLGRLVDPTSVEEVKAERAAH